MEYDKLYSSVPLPEMINMLDNAPQDILQKAQDLEHTGGALVSIGMKKTEFEKFWFYIYDLDIMAARAYMPSVKSAENVPKGYSSIQFEIYFNSKDKAPKEKQAVENTLYAIEIRLCEAR